MREQTKPPRKKVQCYFCGGLIAWGAAHKLCLDENFTYVVGRLEKTAGALRRHRMMEIRAIFHRYGPSYQTSLIDELSKMDWTEEDLAAYAKTYATIQKAST